jgi:hypothetical protein
MPGLCTMTSVSEIANENRLVKCYPNPAHDLLQLEFSNSIIGEQLQVFDYTGKLIFDREIQSEKMNLITQDWTAGLYMIKVGSTNQKTIRIVKE